MDPKLLVTFVEVSEAASFSLAAKKLGTTTATVSRDIAKLEALVGSRLLHRTTRRVSLTTAGSSLFERTALHIRALNAVAHALPEHEQEPAGTLKLTAPYDLGATMLGPLIARFTALYPKVRVHAELSSRTLDLSAEGFDVAFRSDAWKSTTASWSVRQLVRASELSFYASPGYVAGRGAPRTVGSADHDWLIAEPLRRLLRLPKTFEPRIVANDFLFLRNAARAGGGIAMLPVFIAKHELASGELLRVLPNVRLPVGGLVLVYPSARPLPRKISAFRDFLIQSIHELWLQ